MNLALVVLALTPAFFEAYLDRMVIKLDISPTPKLVFTTEQAPYPASPRSRVWVPAWQSEVIKIRKWTLAEAPEAWAEYIILHELCHIKLGHTERAYASATNWKPERAQREVDTDACVRSHVTKKHWEEMQQAWRWMNWRARKLREQGVLPSR
jgi:hypothetical protein